MNLIKKLSTQLALLAGLVFSVSVLSTQSWAAFTIDTYDAPSAPWWNCPNINNVNLQPDTHRPPFYRNIGTLGGQGEFDFYADVLNSPGEYGIKTFIHVRQACTRLNQMVFGGNTEFDNAETTGLSDGGYVHIRYDGKDDDIDTNSFGLGNIDLTEGGINNILRLDISTSHWQNTVDFRIYTDAVNYSQALGVVVPNTGNVYRIFDIKFSEFVQGTEASGPADFTDVNAIELQLNHPRTDRGTPLTVFGIIPVGYGVGLDHFSVNKQLVATLSSGFSETEPDDDINGDGDFDSTSTDADIVTYTVAITNTNDWHEQAADGVIYTAGFSGANASFIDGSVETSQGTITNQTGSVEVDIGSIADGETVTISYKVQIATDVLAPNQEYAHSGTVQTSDGLQFDTAEDVFTINQFDISASLVAAPAAGSDADGDGFSGPGESVTFTATVTNEGPNTTSSVVFYFPEITNASLVTESVTTDYGTVTLGNNSAHTEVEVTISNFPAAELATISFDMIIDEPFHFAEYDSIGGQALLSDTTDTFFVLSDDPNEPGDADPTYIRVDAFPDSDAASVDADGDGLPDEWNDGCEQICQDESGLTKDPLPNDTNNDGVLNDPDNPLADDDGDGVANGDDAFPFHAEASSDTDGDNMPDTCVNDCIGSNLTLDNDDDNDGVPDIEDDFPLNAAAALDSDGDGMPDDWLAACNLDCQDASGLTLDSDDDNDSVPDIEDDFPLNAAAATDTDGDGMPDDWLETCNQACQDASGLTLDDDDDNDGVLDVEDDFPLHVAASLDADGDGMPDEWNASCDITCQENSGLTLDPSLNDFDNDGVIDEEDAFPLNAAASVDDDQDGLPDEWNAGCDSTCQNQSGLTLDSNLNDTNNDGVPNDPDNPLADDDGDGILNGDEEAGFELIDNNPPVVTAPEDRTVSSVGTLTSVSLGQASAEDFLDGTLEAEADNRGPFTVGVHVITWTAVDAAGNVGSDTQTVTVLAVESDDGGANGNSGGGGGGGSMGLFTFLLMLVMTGKYFYFRGFINAR